MSVQTVNPREVVVSAYNERQTFDANDLNELVDSVRQSGVIEPPLVTENDDGALAAYVGQRRVAAAVEAGLDEIPVIVNDVSDEEALVASITENTALFSEGVSPADRAKAIKQLWEMMGGSGTPVFSHVGAKLGVPADTVRTWYEPMREEWEGTSIDPTTTEDDESDDDFFSGENTLGERSLGEVRRMADDKDEAEEAAQTAAELGASQDDLNEAKERAEEYDLPASKAIEDIVGDDEPDDPRMEVEVTFDTTLSQEVESAAEDEGVSEEEVIERAVRQYVGIDSQGFDSGQDSRPEPQTGSDLL